MPNILNKDEINIYQGLLEEFNTYKQKLDFEKADYCMKQIEGLGKPSFLMIHDPNEPYKPLYRTLPSDIAKLIVIQRIVINELFPDRCVLLSE